MRFCIHNSFAVLDIPEEPVLEDFCPRPHTIKALTDCDTLELIDEPPCLLDSSKVGHYLDSR